MPFLFEYILKLSICLAVVYLFYQLVLQKLTFYNWNRWYLLGYSLLSFAIPFVNISFAFEQNEYEKDNVFLFIPSIDFSLISKSSTFDSAGFWNVWSLLIALLMLGAVTFLLLFCIRFFSFLRMRKKAILLLDDKLKIYQVDKNIIPFSFGNAIFINQQLHDQTELQEIIRHEFIHVKQKHTIDIIWGEVLCILNWYNPFAWLFRKAIRQNLEFIADNKVVQKGLDKKQYQYLLLKVIGNNHFSIAQKFNFSSLKKRIAMMNKMRSARMHLIKFLFILPLVAVMLLAFRNTNKGQISFKQSIKDPYATQVADTVAPATENRKGYFIDIIGVGGDCVVVVKNKSKKEIERLLLTKWNDNKDHYENLYGEIPPPPPPPPPPMPPAVLKLPKDVKAIDVDEDIATVTLKNGTKEKYDLKNEKEKAVFERKYGKVLPPPPPPPVPVDKEVSVINIAPEITKKPLVVVDGKQMGKVEEIDKIVKSDEIKSVYVLKGDDAVKKYGEDGKDGVVEINKKASSSITDFNGIILIDGKELAKDKKLEDAVKNPAEIESMHIWKGEKAIEKFGEKGINGVIEIKTKKQ